MVVVLGLVLLLLLLLRRFVLLRLNAVALFELLARRRACFLSFRLASFRSWIACWELHAYDGSRN